MINQLKPQWSYRLEYFTVLLVTLFVLAFVVSGWFAGGAKTLRHVTLLSANVIFCLLTLSLINYALRAFRWQLFSDVLGLAVPVKQNALYYIAGFSMTMTPGKMGEALRLWFLRRGHGYSYEQTAGLLVADRLYDLNAAALLMLASVFVVTNYLFVALISIALAGMITVIFANPKVFFGLASLVTKMNAPKRLKFFVSRLKRAMLLASKMASWPLLAYATAISVVGWLAEGVGFWLLLQAMNVDISLMTAIFIFLFSVIIGALTFLPGGLGGVEASMIGLLISQGASADAAIAATAVTRLVTLWFAVILGFVALPYVIRVANRPASQTPL